MTKVLFGFLLIFLIASCGVNKKTGAIRIDYVHMDSGVEADNRFAQMMFDSISWIVAPAQHLQLLQWKTANGECFLYKENEEIGFMFSGENDKAILYSNFKESIEPYFFPTMVAKSKGAKANLNGLPAKSYVCMVDSLDSDTMFYSTEYKNELPVFEFMKGIPLQFFMDVCGQPATYQVAKVSNYDIHTLEIPGIVLRDEATDDYKINLIPNVHVYGKIKNYYSNEVMPFVLVEVLLNGVVQSSQITSCDGEYEFYLPYGADYIVRFSGADAVAKLVRIDTRNIKYLEDDTGYEMNLDGALFYPISGEDFSFLKEPVIVFTYDPEEENMMYDETSSAPLVSKLRVILDAHK